MTRPRERYFSTSRSRTGLWALHSEHQCAQKKTSTTFPFSWSGFGKRAPARMPFSNRGAGWPFRPWEGWALIEGEMCTAMSRPIMASSRRLTAAYIPVFSQTHRVSDFSSARAMPRPTARRVEKLQLKPTVTPRSSRWPLRWVTVRSHEPYMSTVSVNENDAPAPTLMPMSRVI